MNLKGRNFLTLKDFTPEEITYMIDLAANLKATIFFSAHVDTKSNVNRTFYDTSFAADMIVDRIHKYYSIHFFQRTFLPFFYNRQDFVCDPADCAVRNINIV